MKRIYLIDCPGIVPPSLTDTPEEVLLRGSVRVENVEFPAQYVSAVLARCRTHHLERTYGVKGWSAEVGGGDVGGKAATTEEAVRFLEALARKGGRLLKGGEADLDGVAKMVLNDFLRGKIPWFVPPPTREDEASGGIVHDEENVEVAKEDGRDEMLGFTHKKRKRESEVENDGVESSVQEAEGADSAGSEEEDEELEGSADEEDFDGFAEEDDEDESGSDESHEDEEDRGVNILDGDEKGGDAG